MGVLASGNLFSGLFQKDVLTRGVVSFGQPYAWKARPKALKLQYYAEHIGIADIDKNFGAPIHEGDRDKARIMVAIVDWNTRREVGSGTEAPTGTWDPEETTSVDEGPIIAYGSLFIDQSSTGGKMIDVQLPLNFYDTKAKPSGLYQIVISCSTSAYGDFMAGCKSNILSSTISSGSIDNAYFRNPQKAEPHRFCFLFTLAVRKKTPEEVGFQRFHP